MLQQKYPASNASSKQQPTSQAASKREGKYQVDPLDRMSPKTHCDVGTKGEVVHPGGVGCCKFSARTLSCASQGLGESGHFLTFRINCSTLG